ncbi:MAG: hypothetical protein JNM56_15320 [Planctomycetia bacterium]|nr:hypothetical protein [Planctomycetia bacterium]
MDAPPPTPGKQPRLEPNWVFSLTLLGMMLGSLTRSFLPGCFPGALWGIALGLLARYFIPKDSRLAVFLQEAIRLLLIAAMVVTLIAWCCLPIGPWKDSN